MEDEKIVAVIEPTRKEGETELHDQVTDIELKAESIIVENDLQYEEAGRFGVLLKTKIAEVQSFFETMKKAAHDAHKQVCDREKAMLAPLKNAETLLKDAMSEYALSQEKARKAAEEEARKIAEEEAAKKLEEAIKAEQTGDTKTAESALLDAQIADSNSRMITVDFESPTVKGVSVQKDWEIEDVDLALVPCEVSGVVIRPVDKTAVMKLIRASKGTIDIKGIKYHEKAKMSFRRA